MAIFYLPTCPQDVTAIPTGTSGNPSASATTTTANDLVVATLSRYSTTAATTNRTSLYNNATGSTLGAASYQVATSAGSVSDTYTGSAGQDWSMVLAAFKPGSSGGSSTTNVHYISTDHLTGANVVASSAGAVEELMDYYPFGSARLDEKAGTYSEQRKFTGHEYDADTGLTYMDARYYNASIGRFISQDPAYITTNRIDRQLIDPQSWNSYAYGRNNPIKYNDPDGQFWDTVLDVGFATWDGAQLIKHTGQWLGNEASIGIGKVFGNEDLVNNGRSAVVESGSELKSAALNVGIDAVGTAIPFVPVAAIKSVKVAKTADRALEAGIFLNDGKNTYKVISHSEAAEKAAEHAIGKHIDQRNERGAIIKTLEQLKSYSETVLNKPSDYRRLENGREAFWDNRLAGMVLKNNKIPEKSSTYFPKAGKAYFNGLK